MSQSQDEAGHQLARECPRKILAALHAWGHYLHGTSARFPGKVLCFHKDSPLPEDWTPTPAQLQAWQEASGGALPAAPVLPAVQGAETGQARTIAGGANPPTPLPR